MKKKIVAIALLLFIGVSSNAQSNLDLTKIEIISRWCPVEVDGKNIWEKSPAIKINNKICLDEPEILAIQYQLINKGYKIDPSGIIDTETITAINEYQEYNSKENIRKRNISERKKRKKRKGKK